MRKINYTVDNTIISEVKIEENSGELDFEMYDDLLGKEKVDAAYEDDGIHCINVEAYDPYPIKIEELEKFIEKAKNSGCNYIAIDYNCDHPDYKFYGVELHVANQTEIDTINNKEKQESLSKAVELRKQAENLIKEAEKLSNS